VSGRDLGWAEHTSLGPAALRRIADVLEALDREKPLLGTHWNVDVVASHHVWNNYNDEPPPAETEAEQVSDKIEFNFHGSARLSVSEVWPDGDAPDTITAEAVVKRCLESINLSEFLDDWNLDKAVDVSVRVPSGEPGVSDDVADVPFR